MQRGGSHSAVELRESERTCEEGTENFETTQTVGRVSAAGEWNIPPPMIMTGFSEQNVEHLRAAPACAQMSSASNARGSDDVDMVCHTRFKTQVNIVPLHKGSIPLPCKTHGTLQSLCICILLPLS